MSRTLFSEWDAATDRIPILPYESRWLANAADFLINYFAIFAWVSRSVVSGELFDPLFSAAAAGIYLYGRLLDVHSSQKVSRLVSAADKIRLKHPLYETNPFMSDQPTPEEDAKSPKHILDAIFMAVAAVFPPLGIGMGFSGGLAALNNYRKAERLRVAMNLTEN